MSGTTNEPGGPQAASPAAPQGGAVITQQQVDQAAAQGRDVGANAERERVAGIFAHEGAADRVQLAIQCVTSGLSIEQAGAILGAAPVAAAAAGASNAFGAVMNALGNPDVSGIEERTGDGAQESELAASIVSVFRGAGR